MPHLCRWFCGRPPIRPVYFFFLFLFRAAFPRLPNFFVLTRAIKYDPCVLCAFCERRTALTSLPFPPTFHTFIFFILTWEGNIEEREWTKCVHVIAQHSKTYMPTWWREVSIGPLVCALGANPSLSASDEVLPHGENFPVHEPNHSAVKFIVLIGLASSATWDCFAFHWGALYYFVCVCAPVHNVLFTVNDVSQ